MQDQYQEFKKQNQENIIKLSNFEKLNLENMDKINNYIQSEENYKSKAKELLSSNDIRVEVDDREEKLSYKMRESVVNKIPYTLILGDKERDNNLISYRCFGSNETVSVTKEEFVKLLKEEIKNKHK